MMPPLALISPAASRQMTAVRGRRLVAPFDRRYLREKVEKRRLGADTTYANHAGKLQKRLGSTDVLGTGRLVCGSVFHAFTSSFGDDPGPSGNGGGPRPFAWVRGRPVLGHARAQPRYGRSRPQPGLLADRSEPRSGTRNEQGLASFCVADRSVPKVPHRSASARLMGPARASRITDHCQRQTESIHEHSLKGQ